MKHLRVIACDIFRLEIAAVLDTAGAGQALRERGLELAIDWIPSLLHGDFDMLARAVKNRLSQEGRVLLMYGAKCHPDWRSVIGTRRVAMPGGENCIDIISGLSASLGASRDFHLTSGWYDQWRGFVNLSRKAGLSPEQSRQMFARHCDRAVFHDTGVYTPSEETRAYFAETTGLEVITRPVGLEVFAGTFLDGAAKAAE